MARYMLHNVLISVILCVAILFLSGIALPKLFAKQYLELRSELNAHSEDLKLNHKGNSNSTSTFEKLGNASLVESTTVWKNVSTKLQKRDLSTEVTSLKHVERIKRRKKRQAYSKSNDKLFAWNFNLNVTRFNNNTPTTPNKSKYSAQNESNNYLGMAVYVEGNGPKRTYRELENAWSSVGAFIRSLFGNDVESLPPKLENQKNDGVFAISGSLQTNSDLESTQISSIERFNNEGSGDGSPHRIGRKGKFIFEFLGLGGKSLDKTTQFSESEDITKTIDPTFISDKTQINNFRKDINLLNGALEKSEIVTESNERVGLQPVSPALNANHLLTNNFTDVSNLNSSKNLEKANIPTMFGSNDVTDMDGCSACDIESSEVSKRVQPGNVLDTAVASNVVFTDEELEKYCMDLVNQLEESQRFLSAISNISDIQDENFKEGNQVSSARGPEIFDLLSLFSALQQSQLNSNSAIIEDSSLVGETISPSIDEQNIHENRQSRFFNLNMFGFGSGRSAFEDTSDLISDDRNSDADIENLPSILDCENYFRKKQNIKMFPKPNLMDVISDPNIKLTDFSNGSISLKLKEQQLKFLIDRLKTSLNNSSLEKSNVSSENELKNPPSLETNTLSESFSSNINPNIKENVGEIKTVVPEFNLSDNDLVENEINTEIQHVTELSRDGRIFSFLGFGSGNGGSEDTAFTERNGRFFINSFLGSGERSLGTLDTTNEPNMQMLGNEDSFQESTFFSDDSRIVDSGTDVLPDLTAPTLGQERRLWSLMGLSGSGDGKQLDESLDLTQTRATPFVDECGSDCSFEIHNTTGISRDCNYEECNINNLHEDTPVDNYGDYEKGASTDTELAHANLPSHSHQNNKNDCNDCNYGSNRHKESSNFKTDSHEILLTDKEPANVNAKNSNTFTELQNTTESDLKTEKSRLFIGPGFLTGSGDGGLFRDGEEPINLVEESTVIRQISRGGRLLDEDSVTGIAEISNKYDESTFKPNGFPGRRGRLEDLEGNIKESTAESGKIFPKDTTLKQPVQFPNRRGTLDEEFSLDQSSPKIPAKDNSISTDHKTVTTESFRQNQATNSATELIRIASSSEVTSSISEVPNTIFKAADSEPRFCISASQCSIELNEGCVRSSHSSVCGCRRQFVRHKETGECVAKSTVKVSLRFPAEEFDEDLVNQFSPRFKDMKTKASDTMLLLLGETPELVPILAGLDVTDFSPGSLIVSWNLELAARNESEFELLKHVENGLKKALTDDILIEKAPLDVRNASVLSVSGNVDPCKSMEMNYCSENAICIRTSSFPGFTCRCKDDYFDASSSKKYPGEICEALCPSDYCGDNGHCEYLENEGKRCLCRGWYFGDRCEISGVVVVASFSANLFLIIAGIFITIVCRRCRKTSYVAPQEFRRSEEVGMNFMRPKRVSDAIAFEDNAGARMARFHGISTPIPNPVIKVTNPTLNESSLSFDYDSTFDRTSSVQGNVIQTPSGQNVMVQQTQSTI